jgi:hypothetical protein
MRLDPLARGVPNCGLVRKPQRADECQVPEVRPFFGCHAAARQQPARAEDIGGAFIVGLRRGEALLERRAGRPDRLAFGFEPGNL